MKSITVLDKVSRGSLYAAAALLPLWFLPLTQNVLVYQKQALLVLLVFVGLVAWLAKVVNEGEVRLRVSPLYIPAAALLLGVGISTLLSKWTAASFWGWPLDLTDSFLTLAVFALFSFLLFQVPKDALQLFRVLVLLVLSSGLAVLYALLQAYELYLLPALFSQAPTFNTIGNINGVAVFAAVLLPVTLVLAFASERLLRWALWASALVLLASLVLLNFQTAWLVLVAGLLVLMAFGMWNMKRRQDFRWVSLPMALLIVAVFFLVFQARLPGAPQNIPIEVSPSQGATFGIARNVLADRALFGSGPGTFSLEYSQFRPAELNQTVFFGTRFSSGASELLDWLVTKGIVGLALLLAFFGALAVLGAKLLLRKETESFSWMLGLGVFASLVSLLVSQLLYPSSFLTWFLFWVLAGSLAFVAAKEPRVLTVAKNPLLALSSSFTFLLILIFGLGLLFIGGQKYAAEVQYLQGLRSSAEGNLEGAITRVLSASRLNPAVDLYWRDLAQLYLARVNTVAAESEISQEERNQRIQNAVSTAVAAAQNATLIAPANVANWNVRGFVYRNLIGVEGALDIAVQSYEKAAELEPNSPFPWTELGRAYVLQAQSLERQGGSQEEQEQALATALERLNRALELKSDYAPAHYLTAIIYDQRGNTQEAIAKLEETKAIAPNDVGLAFQLGVIYWQRQELDRAQAELERAKRINPSYSNARYILGLVYDANGQKESARLEFSEVERLNPENAEVKRILSNLENGLPALEGIEVSQPPIQETPPEIQEPSASEGE